MLGAVLERRTAGFRARAARKAAQAVREQNARRPSASLAIGRLDLQVCGPPPAQARFICRRADAHELLLGLRHEPADFGDGRLHGDGPPAAVLDGVGLLALLAREYRRLVGADDLPARLPVLRRLRYDASALRTLALPERWRADDEEHQVACAWLIVCGLHAACRGLEIEELCAREDAGQAARRLPQRVALARAVARSRWSGQPLTVERLRPDEGSVMLTPPPGPARPAHHWLPSPSAATPVGELVAGRAAICGEVSKAAGELAAIAAPGAHLEAPAGALAIAATPGTSGGPKHISPHWADQLFLVACVLTAIDDASLAGVTMAVRDALSSHPDWRLAYLVVLGAIADLACGASQHEMRATALAAHDEPVSAARLLATAGRRPASWPAGPS
jgi:hypothetical protein